MNEEDSQVKVKLKAFVSCSLRQEDKIFVDFVESVLRENDFEPFGTVGKYSAAPVNPTESMKENIHLADIAVIIATRRYEQKDVLTGNVSFGPSEMIHAEVAMSFMASKPVVVIVQQGTDVGSFIPNITQFIVLDGTPEDLNQKGNILKSLLKNAGQMANNAKKLSVVNTRLHELSEPVVPDEIHKLYSQGLHHSKMSEIELNGSMKFELDSKGAGQEKLRLKYAIHILNTILSGPILNPRITLYKGNIRIKRSDANKALHLGEPLLIQASSDYPKFNHRDEIKDVFTITFGGDNSKLYYSRYSVRLFCNLELIVSPNGAAWMGPKYDLEITVEFENRSVDTNNIFE